MAEPVYPRSALKPFQAIAMLQSGLDLEGPDLALASASHQGEPVHVAAVESILRRSGLAVDHLQSPPAYPGGEGPFLDWVAAGRPKMRIAHECSGKHAAMLRTCLLNDWSTESYLDPEHPLHQRIAGVIAEYSGEDVAAPTVDGCGAPAFPLTLPGLARGFGRIAAAEAGPAHQIAQAFRKYPEFVSGTGHQDLLLHRAVPGIVCKVGAEAIYAAGLSDGTGLAVKVSDGSGRGLMELVVAVLRSLGVDAPGLEPMAISPVLGGGEPVGQVRVRAQLELPNWR